MPERIDLLKRDLFIDSPADVLVAAIAAQLKTVPQWTTVFGDFIDPYKKMDYGIRNLPAMRIYNELYTKEFESWYIVGDIIADMIFPASVRRSEVQSFQDIVTAAMMQQFRRPTFFNQIAEQVPGLNELGKRFSIDKSLAFAWDDQEVPLTQITINFRMNLEQWDIHLEQTNRTKDDPFNVTLGDLKKIVNSIKGLEDDNTTVNIQSGQDTAIGG